MNNVHRWPMWSTMAQVLRKLTSYSSTGATVNEIFVFLPLGLALPVPLPSVIGVALGLCKTVVLTGYMTLKDNCAIE